MKLGKTKGFKYLHVQNEINSEFHALKISLPVANEPYIRLLERFQAKDSFYEAKFQIDFILQDIKREFFKPDLTYVHYNFEDFINDLANYESHNDILNLFLNNSDIYRLMFELNQFDDFNNLTKFDIIHYDSQISLTSIFLELVEKKKKSLGLESEDLPIKEDEKSSPIKIEEDEPNYFQLEKLYISKFKKLTTYHKFCHEYINEVETSHEDFINVFFKDPTSHNSDIYFFCTTQACSHLLFKLADLFKGLNLTIIQNIKKFISSDGNYLSQSNISNSKSDLTQFEKTKIDNFIEELKSL
ncbi:hypothetical protein [Gelidibacter japonicus]|uniref:hypothetical protein n=1 Tax=Gelidibacter japonicus TaxID=1962232 RepID=UPI003A95501D